MGIVFTDKWIKEWSTDPSKFCKQLEPYFQSIDARTIQHVLTMNGMYRQPAMETDSFLHRLPDMIQTVKKEYRTLQREWNGPDIPLFIFPSDPENRRLSREFNSKSGLAFKDKLFLFLSEDNSSDEIRALFTHEYNHTCRLTHYSKKEEDFTLLDTVVLEGLAENAVHERIGEDHLASWTAYYSDTELESYWEKIIQPNKDVSIHHRKHHQILYGGQFLPKMVGYAVGYSIVKGYRKKKKRTVSSILHLPSEEIVAEIFNLESK